MCLLLTHWCPVTSVEIIQPWGRYRFFYKESPEYYCGEHSHCDRLMGSTNGIHDWEKDKRSWKPEVWQRIHKSLSSGFLVRWKLTMQLCVYLIERTRGLLSLSSHCINESRDHPDMVQLLTAGKMENQKARMSRESCAIRANMPNHLRGYIDTWIASLHKLCGLKQLLLVELFGSL